MSAEVNGLTARVLLSAGKAAIVVVVALGAGVSLWFKMPSLVVCWVVFLFRGSFEARRRRSSLLPL